MARPEGHLDQNDIDIDHQNFMQQQALHSGGLGPDDYNRDNAFGVMGVMMENRDLNSKN